MSASYDELIGDLTVAGVLEGDLSGDSLIGDLTACGTLDGTLSAFESLDGELTVEGSLEGDLSAESTLEGFLSSSDRVILEMKFVTPTEETQIIMADEGYDGLLAVEVGEIPSNYGLITWTGHSLIVS